MINVVKLFLSFDLLPLLCGLNQHNTKNALLCTQQWLSEIFGLPLQSQGMRGVSHWHWPPCNKTTNATQPLLPALYSRSCIVLRLYQLIECYFLALWLLLLWKLEIKRKLILRRPSHIRTYMHLYTCMETLCASLVSMLHEHTTTCSVRIKASPSNYSSYSTHVILWGLQWVGVCVCVFILNMQMRNALAMQFIVYTAFRKWKTHNNNNSETPCCN